MPDNGNGDGLGARLDGGIGTGIGSLGDNDGGGGKVELQ